MNRRKLEDAVGKLVIRSLLGVTLLFLLVFLVVLFAKGGKVLSWSFLVQSPRSGMTAGGIYPAIVGTFWLTVISMLIAFPLGLITAVYLVSYGKPLWLVRLLKVTVNTLAGIPSICFGLFGLTLFVNAMHLNVSLLSGSLTLGILALPIIINNSEEALRTVPKEFRDASLALGATERQTILRVLIPSAFPSILTGAIISIGRIAGETAPIMFTAVTFYTRKLPTSLQDEVMALPYHIYALMTEGTHPEKQVPIAYGTALVLLLVVMAVSSVSIVLRYKMRKEKIW